MNKKGLLAVLGIVLLCILTLVVVLFVFYFEGKSSETSHTVTNKATTAPYVNDNDEFPDATKFTFFELTNKTDKVFSGENNDLLVLIGNDIYIYNSDGDYKVTRAPFDIDILTVGRNHTYIMDNQKNLYEFDYNTGDTSEKILTDIVDISTGEDSYAAVASDGSLYVWGNNKDGQLGLEAEYIYEPEKIDYLSDVAQVSCGIGYTLVRTKAGNIYESGFCQYTTDSNPSGCIRRYTLIKDLKNIVDISCCNLRIAADDKGKFHVGKKVKAIIVGTDSTEIMDIIHIKQERKYHLCAKSMV